MPHRARRPLSRVPKWYGAVPSHPSRLPHVRFRPTAQRPFVQPSVLPATRARVRRPCARHSAPPDAPSRHRPGVHSVRPDAPSPHRPAHVDPCLVRRVARRGAPDHDQWVRARLQVHLAPVVRHDPADRAPVSVDRERVDPRRVPPQARAVPDQEHVARVVLVAPSVRPRVVVVVTSKSSSPPR